MQKPSIFPHNRSRFHPAKKKKRKIRNTSLFIYYNFYIHYFPKLSVFLRDDEVYAAKNARCAAKKARCRRFTQRKNERQIRSETQGIRGNSARSKKTNTIITFIGRKNIGECVNKAKIGQRGQS